MAQVVRPHLRAAIEFGWTEYSGISAGVGAEFTRVGAGSTGERPAETVESKGTVPPAVGAPVLARGGRGRVALGDLLRRELVDADVVRHRPALSRGVVRRERARRSRERSCGRSVARSATRRRGAAARRQHRGDRPARSWTPPEADGQRSALTVVSCRSSAALADVDLAARAAGGAADVLAVKLAPFALRPGF